ncbi:hypothetical protein B0T21DRAFT_411550 [Apiosordaria backusii]|uniref:Uncharacterized protein n=1 Tax=Apiosordaria backusii TaxID=314023 RepID=A0AA40BLC4_9PEZI|nr:hypothetical protein B0T21DRAFT_411550 [Apiosordaria backusii]
MSATETPPPFVEPYPGYAEDNKGPTILGVTSAMTLLGTMFILCVIYVGLAGAAISHGGGRHLDTLSQEDVKKALYYTVISFVPGVSSFTIPKFAVVLFQLQLNWRKKLALSSSLGFGYCAGVITCYNIEANCVIIGGCIPCLHPLIRKLFGNSVLGGASSNRPTGNSKSGGLRSGSSGPSNTVITIGSYPKNKGRKRGKLGSHMVSNLDTINDLDAGSKYIILEERSFHCSTTELTEQDAVAANAQIAHKKDERATKQEGW